MFKGYILTPEMSNFIVGDDGLPVNQKVKTTIHGDPYGPDIYYLLIWA